MYMEALVRSDIFFFITTIAVVAVAAGFIIVLIYIVKILRDVRYISRRLKEESDVIIEDVEALRTFLKKEGKKASRATEFVGSMLNIFPRRKRSRIKK